MGYRYLSCLWGNPRFSAPPSGQGPSIPYSAEAASGYNWRGSTRKVTEPTVCPVGEGKYSAAFLTQSLANAIASVTIHKKCQWINLEVICGLCVCKGDWCSAVSGSPEVCLHASSSALHVLHLYRAHSVIASCVLFNKA